MEPLRMCKMSSMDIIFYDDGSYCEKYNINGEKNSYGWYYHYKNNDWVTYSVVVDHVTVEDGRQICLSTKLRLTHCGKLNTKPNTYEGSVVNGVLEGFILKCSKNTKWQMESTYKLGELVGRQKISTLDKIDNKWVHSYTESDDIATIETEMHALLLHNKQTYKHYQKYNDYHEVVQYNTTEMITIKHMKTFMINNVVRNKGYDYRRTENTGDVYINDRKYDKSGIISQI